MGRPFAFCLLAAGALLVLPQLVRDYPAQILIVVGLVLALIGGLLLCDHAPSPRPLRRNNGNR